MKKRPINRLRFGAMSCSRFWFSRSKRGSSAVGISGCLACSIVCCLPWLGGCGPNASPPEPTIVESSDFPFQQPALTDAEIQAGWISLFDGHSLFGWDVPQQSNWHVADGSIVADSGERSLLLTPFRFGDFELRCDFHLAAGGNSGIFLRTAENPTNPAKDTYELNICDTHESHATGSLVGRYVATDVPAVEGDWHTFRVRCEGSRVQVWLDEKPIVDFDDQTPDRRTDGRIGLQMNSGRIAFKNVLLRPIGEVALFNGKDLTGWTVVPGSESRFDVDQSAIHVTGGRGFLETDGEHKDFILHSEVRTNGELLNSGVFFRAAAGTSDAPSNGYEMQIQNGFQDGDRAVPQDCGTGGIFRRIDARYVVSNDHQWTTMTLIAQGDRFATWVNGYQVVNWQDTRTDNENPREGRRLAGGRISLQGHDPATDLDFRSLRLHTLPTAD